MGRLTTACLVLLPALALAQGTPLGTAAIVNAGPGQQSDPHVSGDVVAYTSLVEGSSQIRYHDLATGQDYGIPNDGAFDFLSDVSDNTVVFTRVTETNEAIYRYDVTTHGPAVELAPNAESHRRAAAIGGSTVAWQDHGFGTASEIVVTDIATGTVTRLTEDSLTDRSAAVSPDGLVVAWVKCQTESSGCDVWQSVAAGSGWSSMALTNAESEDSLPDTNGAIVVYGSARMIGGVLERDIYWQEVGGGPEMRLALPGNDSNPNIADHLIAFERRDPATPTNADIVVYDLKTDTLYRITETPQHESLNDISISAAGIVRVVWTRSDEGDQNVYAFSFPLGDGTACSPLELTSCQDPGTRPLLGTLEVSRLGSAPSTAEIAFEATPGAGLLCIWSEQTTSATVTLNDAVVFKQSTFNPKLLGGGGEISLASENLLSASVGGKKDGGFRVKIFGAPFCSAGESGAGSGLVRVYSGKDGNVVVHTEVGGRQILNASAVGCSAAETSSFAVLMALIALAMLLEARRVRVSTRRHGSRGRSSRR